jgi:hypothetical protein
MISFHWGISKVKKNRMKVDASICGYISATGYEEQRLDGGTTILWKLAVNLSSSEIFA